MGGRRRNRPSESAFPLKPGEPALPQITTRDAVTRALAAMEIAESCSHPQIRTSFTTLAENWLQQAEELGRGGPPEEAAGAAEQPGA
jgi:hypothetical protein